MKLIKGIYTIKVVGGISLSFTMIILLVFVILTVTFGSILILKSKRKIGVLILSIPLLLVMFLGGYWIYMVNHHFVKSTHLEEKFGEVALNEKLDDDLKERYGVYEYTENVYYDKMLHFSQLSIGLNESNEIIYLSTKDSKVSILKDVHVGDRVKDITELYGLHYYIDREMGMGDSMNYVDRKSRIHLQFYYQDDIVTRIVFRKI